MERCFLLLFPAVLLGCGPRGGQEAVVDDTGEAPPDGPSVDAPADELVDTAAPMLEGPHGYACTEVASLPGDGIFSMQSFGDRLLVGAFGEGMEATSMLWSWPDWQRVEPGILGVSESVCALETFQGAVFANTENSGDIFRSTNGTEWTKVVDGAPGAIGCGMAVFDGAIYAVSYNYATQSHGQILRSTDGVQFETVWSGPNWSPYLRELVVHDGELYAYGVNTQADQGFWLRSPDGVSWFLDETPSRFFRGLSWNGAMYSGSTTQTSNGPAGVYRTESGQTEMVYATSKAYVTELQPWDGVLFAGTSAGWGPTATGTSSLLMSRTGTDWQEVCDFDELAVWAVEAHEGSLYVGTFEEGSGGRLYRVEIDPEGRGLEPPPEISDPGCLGSPSDPPVQRQIRYDDATYTRRHNWVLGCYPYAYTAANYEEHHPCDAQFVPDGSRTGKAIFDFEDVPRGRYRVEVRSRHTENRNPAGALFIVDGHAVRIDQRDDSGDYVWDLHGTWCLDGDVQAVLDSTVDNGSDDVVAIRLTPAP